MITITKAEKEAILERYPHAHIVRTMKQKSSRHKYYCVEDTRIVNLLEDIRKNASKGV